MVKSLPDKLTKKILEDCSEIRERLVRVETLLEGLSEDIKKFNHASTSFQKECTKTRNMFNNRLRTLEISSNVGSLKFKILGFFGASIVGALIAGLIYFGIDLIRQMM